MQDRTDHRICRRRRRRTRHGRHGSLRSRTRHTQTHSISTGHRPLPWVSMQQWFCAQFGTHERICQGGRVTALQHTSHRYQRNALSHLRLPCRHLRARRSQACRTCGEERTTWERNVRDAAQKNENDHSRTQTATPHRETDTPDTPTQGTRRDKQGRTGATHRTLHTTRRAIGGQKLRCRLTEESSVCSPTHGERTHATPRTRT